MRGDGALRLRSTALALLCATASSLHIRSYHRRAVPLNRGRSARVALSASSPPGVVPLRDALAAYDALLLDQFGVLHDGAAPYAGAAEAVRELQRVARKRIVILSNSSKRRIETVNRLHALGFGMCTWLESASVAGVPLITVVTSGDIVWNELREKMRAPASGFQPGLSADAISIPAGAVSGTKAVIADIIAAAELAAEAGEFARESEIQIAADAIFELAGSWCVVYGNGDDDDEYVGTAGCTAAAVEQADFILARGMFELRTGRGEGGAQPFDSELHGEALLRRALERGLPMIVANPDMVRPDGKDSPMPGVLAAQYAQMGGDVRYVGKPHTRVYQAAMRQLNSEDEVASARVVAVGDSMEHDILGARRAGFDAILITGGVHASELGVAQGEGQVPSPERLAAFLGKYPPEEWPTHVCAGFVLESK